MSIFTEGSNRQRVYDQLSDFPITINEIFRSTGIDEKAIKSVLEQIRAIGYSDKKLTAEGNKGWIKLKKTKSIPKTKTGMTKKFRHYIDNNVGTEFTTTDLAKILNAKASSNIHKLMIGCVKSGILKRVNDTRPYLYQIQKTQSEPQQTELQPIQPDVAVLTSPMGVSDAISTLMQSEHQNMIYKQGLTQILALYNQLGNVLEMMGLLEE